MLPNDLRTVLRPRVGAVLGCPLQTDAGVLPAGRFVALEAGSSRGDLVAFYVNDVSDAPVLELPAVDAAALVRWPTADDERAELSRIFPPTGRRQR